MRLLSEFTDGIFYSVFTLADCVTHDIKLIDNTIKLKNLKQYYLSPDKYAEVRKHPEKYLKKGFIRPISSPYRDSYIFSPQKRMRGFLCAPISKLETNKQAKVFTPYYILKTCWIS